MTTVLESLISEIQNLWGSSFFSKYSKFNLDFENVVKNWEKVFSFSGNRTWIGIVKLSLLRTGYSYLQANVLSFCMSIREIFPTQLTWRWSMNMIKVLWRRFQQCLGTCVMLLVERSSETGLFKYLSNHVLGVCIFGNTKVMRVIFFFQMFKI